MCIRDSARCVQVAPEAFDSDRLRNLVRGEWRRIGIPGDHINSVDGTPIPGPPLINHDAVSYTHLDVYKRQGVS